MPVSRVMIRSISSALVRAASVLRRCSSLSVIVEFPLVVAFGLHGDVEESAYEYP